MSRLQKKCFLGATGFHLMLLAILVIGPAFLSREKVDDSPVIEFIPTILTDEKLSNPGASAPRPAPQPQPQAEVQPPPPQPQPQPVRQPDPPKVELPRNNKPDPDAVETKADKKTREVQVSDKIVKIPRDTKPTSRTTSTATSDNRRQQEVAKAIKSIRGNLSQTTTVEMPEGPGGGSGPSYANYAQEVRRIYTEAWHIPPDVDDDEATVKVTVVVARGGNVVSSRILQSSGSPAVDRSIQTTLDRVTFIAPFPAGAKDLQRTFTISFSLKAKKLLG
jgi:TonB family protein